jgi:hypothetical protein
LLAHSIPPVGLGDRLATREHGERRNGIVPKKERYFLAPIRRFGHGEVEVGINSLPRTDIKVHTTQHPPFHARALQELGAKKVVPHIEVGLDPHIDLTQGHKGRHAQDP